MRITEVAVGLMFTAATISVGATVRADANAIVDRAISALGGTEKLSKVKAASWKGTTRISGADFVREAAIEVTIL